ncbi:MAG: hypothetical protein ACYS0I_02890 [Planctomycetota bacterium]|jgi:hypothetical protein
MAELLAQIVLVAQRSDNDGAGWMQILVFVILAVLYAVGSILKAKGGKLEEQGEEAEGEQKGGSKPAERVRARQLFQKLEEVLEEKVQRPAGLKPQERDRQAVPVQRKVMRPQRVGRPVTEIQPELEVLPELTEQAIKKLEDKAIGIVPEKLKVKPVGELLEIEPFLVFDEPDRLKKAILHYEIVGKPLSLRGSSERVIGL